MRFSLGCLVEANLPSELIAPETEGIARHGGILLALISARVTLTSSPRCIKHFRTEPYHTWEGASNEEGFSLENTSSRCGNRLDGKLYIDGNVSMGKGRRRIQLR